MEYDDDMNDNVDLIFDDNMGDNVDLIFDDNMGSDEFNYIQKMLEFCKDDMNNQTVSKDYCYVKSDFIDKSMEHDCCASSASIYTGPIVNNEPHIYFGACKNPVVTDSTMGYITDPDDWFLKKAAKENKIKKFWRKLWK